MASGSRGIYRSLFTPKLGRTCSLFSAATPHRPPTLLPPPSCNLIERVNWGSSNQVGEIDDGCCPGGDYPTVRRHQQCVDGRALVTRFPPSMTARLVDSECADGMSKVLEDNNLLMEILLRVGFPTTLVRAALVCKRWYHQVSDRRFLKSFRKRHPPRLLGFYMDDWPQPDSAPRFVPMLPQPLELAAVVRRIAGYSFGPYDETLSIRDCRNGNILTTSWKGTEFRYGLHRPLCPEGGMSILLPLPTAEDPLQKILDAVLSKEEGDGLSYLYTLAEWTTGATNFKISLYVLQDDSWCLRTMATDQILQPLMTPKLVLASDKIYMISAFSDIVVFDFTASSLSRIPLRQEVKYHYFSTTLSRAADDSGVYLTHVNEFQLCIWLHKGDNWLLVHTICLHEMCANLRMLDQTLEVERVFPYICHVGDNAEFVFLKMCWCTLYLDVTSKTLHKVHNTDEKDQLYSFIYPFMMTWPPIFPALNDDPARNDM